MDFIIVLSQFIYNYLVTPLPLVIISILLISFFTKDKFRTVRIFNLIRWFIIYYSLFSIFHMVIRNLITPQKFHFLAEDFGPYQTVFLLVFTFQKVIPFSLLNDYLAKNVYYLLFISLGINIIEIFTFIDILTITNSDKNSTLSIFPKLIDMLTKSIIITPVLLYIFRKRN